MSKEQTADPVPAQPQSQTPSTQTQSQPAQTQPTQPSAPTQNTNGTITVVTPEGKTLILTPNGKGWYKDQNGCPRDVNGNRVSNIDGSPYQELPMGEGMYTGDIDSLLDNYNFSTN